MKDTCDTQDRTDKFPGPVGDVGKVVIQPYFDLIEQGFQYRFGLR